MLELYKQPHLQLGNIMIEGSHCTVSTNILPEICVIKIILIILRSNTYHGRWWACHVQVIRTQCTSSAVFQISTAVNETLVHYYSKLFFAQEVSFRDHQKRDKIKGVSVTFSLQLLETIMTQKCACWEKPTHLGRSLHQKGT